jgi:hypothetical protein
MSNPLYVGQPCRTPQGAGRIVYWRYAPPDYNRIAAVSVVLETAPPRFLAYAGTVYPARDVQIETGGTWIPLEADTHA